MKADARYILSGLTYGFRHHPRSRRLAIKAAVNYLGGYATAEDCESVLAMPVGWAFQPWTLARQNKIGKEGEKA